MSNYDHEIRDAQGQRPLAYFITFSCYGTRLHGDENGSVDRFHNQPSTPFVPPNVRRLEAKEEQLKQPVFIMDQARRAVVLRTLTEVADYRGWKLLAAHVRSSHVHLVIQADEKPEKIMNDVKSYASRRLNEAKLDDSDRKRWTRHGSTRYLWKWEDVENAVHYTLHEQGDVMEVYSVTEPRP